MLSNSPAAFTQYARTLEALEPPVFQFNDATVNNAFSTIVATPRRRDSFASATLPLSVEAINFELRQVREHLAKLKFNVLESGTKKRFLSRLLDGDEWERLMAGEIWTPAEIRRLEEEAELEKTELKRVKDDLPSLTTEIKRLAEHLCSLQETVHAEHESAKTVLTALDRAYKELEELKVTVELPLVPHRPISDIQADIIDQQTISAKMFGELDAQRKANEELQRLATHHEDELSRLLKSASELEKKAEAISNAKKSEQESKLQELCDWYQALMKVMEGMAGVCIEMSRPDLLVLTWNNGAKVIANVQVDPSNGKLIRIDVLGSNASELKPLTVKAVELDSLSFFVHSTSRLLL